MGWFLYFLVAFVWWVFIYRLLYLHHIREFTNLEFDDSDRIFGVLWGGAVACVWPLSLAVFALAMIVKYVLTPALKLLEK